MIKTLSSMLVTTLTNTFPTAPGMAPKESANWLRHTLYWLHCTKKNGNFCHVPFSLLWNPSEAGVGGVLHSRVLLWVPRNGNFCLTNLLWHILSSMLGSSGLVENISTVYPVFSLRCHSSRQEEEEDAQQKPLLTQKATSNGSLLCTRIKRGKMAGSLIITYELNILTKLFSQWSWKKVSKNCVDNSG